MKKLYLLPLIFALGCGGAADSPSPIETDTSNPTGSASDTTENRILRPVVTDFTTGETLDPNPDYGTTTSDGVVGNGGGTSDGPGTGGTGTSDGPGTGGTSGTTSDGPGTGGTTSDGPGTGGTTSDGVGGSGNTDDGSGGTGGTTSDGVGGSGGTTSDGSGGSSGTDDGVGGTGGTTSDGSGGTGLTYDAPPPPPPAPPPPPSTGGTTGDGSGGTGNTDDGSGGTGLTYDVPPPPPPVPPPPPETGGTGGTNDGSGGTSGTDDNTGGSGGSYTPPSEDCPWVCIPPVYEEVNVIVLNDAWLENCDVEGRLFVGNDATFPSYAVGTRMTPDASRYDLVVGNDLVYNNGSVPNGAVAYGGTLSRTGSVFAYGGWHQDEPVDFDQLNNDMLYWSDSLAAQPPTGETIIQYGGITLVGTEPALNIFELDAADLASCNGLTISVPAGATALVNVSGTNVTMQNFGIFFADGADKQYTMFNMYEAEDVTFSGIGVNGSVLAPRADLDFTSGNIDGQLVVENYVVQGRVSGEGHPYYFQGCPWVCL